MKTLELFVYGSLRPGQCNYQQLSQQVLKIRPVAWPGQLVLRPEGYPVYLPELPQMAGCLHSWELPQGAASEATPEGNVLGEWLTLRDDGQVGPRLDAFEGFVEDDPEYIRVAVAWGGRWIWTYTAPPGSPDWPRIERWPHQDEPIPPWR